MLDTTQLRSFLAIVDTGSFTRASERVNKTQSTVSMHIRGLEAALSCSLFIKQGRGVQLSLAGEELVGFARKMLETESLAMASLSRKGTQGRILLGMAEEYAGTFIVDILDRFRQRHPLVEVLVTCDGGSPKLAEQVRSLDLDIALLSECDETQDIEITREEPLVWAASSQLALNVHAPLPIVCGPASCPWRRRWEPALQSAGRSFQSVLVSNSFSSTLPFVRAGLAVGILPRGLVPQDLRIITDLLPALPNTRSGILLRSNASAITRSLADDIRFVSKSLAPRALDKEALSWA